MNYLIVGGVAGGATVAARLRRMDEHANIVLFERGKYVSYANCGLPYYIGGTIADRNKLFVQSVEGFTRRFRIDIRTEQEVVRIDRESGWSRCGAWPRANSIRSPTTSWCSR